MTLNRIDLFVQEFLVDLNGTAAARRAGYKGNERTLAVTGARLLRSANVAKRIEAAKVERMNRTKITADVVLGEILRLSRADLADAFDKNGNLKPIHEIPEDVRRAISAVEVDELFDGKGKDRKHVGFTRKVKFWDKTKALELLCKHLGLLVEKHEVTGKDGAPLVAGLAEVPTDVIRAEIARLTGKNTTKGKT